MVEVRGECAGGGEEFVFDHYVDVVCVEAGAEGGGWWGERRWGGGGCAG